MKDGIIIDGDDRTSRHFEKFCETLWNGTKGARLGLVPKWTAANSNARADFREIVKAALAAAVQAIPENRPNTKANLLWFADLQPKEG